MNSIIETLNQWGGNFLAFGWPMLWQSSLLIAVLFALDFSLRRRLRASIRYALWLVVLVKLCLPPTLALPTSPAWWMHKTPPPIATKPKLHFTVTYDNTPLPEIPQTPLPAFVPPKPAMTNAAWLSVAAVAVSVALFAWLLVRWWQITGQIRHAAASGRLNTIAAAAQNIVGFKMNVPVKLAANSISPAVCGFFHPAILIPQSVAENFADEQLLTVLVHELIHLRRRDVWVNFLQTLLQVVYWWHPLVWMANARIRRVREEAVDDAVMLALRDEADTYAPTLLEVAKLALNRPLATLGLVGIMESRGALRQRIERLVDFRAPRHAGLTLVSILGILAFTAVAVPMGEGPVLPEKVSTPAIVPASPLPKPASINTNLPEVLITTRFYQAAAALKSDQDKGTAITTSLVMPAEFAQLQTSLESKGYRKFSGPRMVTISGERADMYVGNGTNSTSFSCRLTLTNGLIELMVQGQVVYPLNGGLATNQFKGNMATIENHGGVMISVVHSPGSGWTNLVVLAHVEIITNTQNFQQRPQAIVKPTGEIGRSNFIATVPGRQAIIAKLKQIRLAEFSSAGLPLSEVLRRLSEQSLLRETNHAGINFLTDDHEDNSGIPVSAINPLTGMPILLKPIPSSGQPPQTNPATGISYNSADVPVTVAAMQDVTLADVLDAVVAGASRPIKYSVQDFAIVFSLNQPPANPLFGLVFLTDTNSFLKALQKVTSLQTISVPVQAQSYFSTLGVDWDSPPGKSISYQDRSGRLYVKATGSDLRLVERALDQLAGSALEKPPVEKTAPMTMTFRVDPRVLLVDLTNQLAEAGVKIPTTFYFYTANGILFVRGSGEQLARVNRVVLKLNGLSDKNIEADARQFVGQTATFGLDDTSTTNLFTRAFKVDPRLFPAALRNIAGEQTNTVSAMARSFFSQLGVNLDFPAGKSVFYGDRLGVLFVKATESDLDIIERAIQTINTAPPQIHIKARFVEVPKLGFVDPKMFTNHPNGQMTGILTGEDFKTILQLLQAKPGFELLAEPEATTTSGRQMQMRATQIMNFVTNLVLEESYTNRAGLIISNTIVPQSTRLETGPVLDVVPYVLADGYTISLALIPTLTEFWGYDTPTNTTTGYDRAGEIIHVPKVSPHFTVRQVVATVNLWDGQTAMLGGLPEANHVSGSVVTGNSKTSDKELLVFITANIVDPADNRIHSDDDLPFAKNGVPSQPPQPPQPSQPSQTQGINSKTIDYY